MIQTYLPALVFLALGAIFALTVMAGSSTATAPDGSMVATATLPFGITRLLGGFAFSLGLILVVVAGAELFTGNNLVLLFARYAFDVKVGRVLTSTERKHLRAIVNYMKPAHTHFVNLIEPLPPIVPDHWELGLSELGETATLH